MPTFLVMYSNQPPSDAHIDRLRMLGKNTKVIVANSGATAVALAPQVDVILGHRYLHQVLPHVQRLAWIQSTAAGVEHLFSEPLRRLAPILTRAPIFSDVVAFHAIAMALAMVRRLPEAAAAQTAGKWRDPAMWAKPCDMLPLPRSAMVLGMGCVGQEIARSLRGMGIRVVGMNRTLTDPKRLACDELVGPQEWQALLAATDLLFVALPLTEATRRMIDASVLCQLPSHAVVVNVARGDVVDISALCDALRAGRLGGAAVDVLDPIPTSASAGLWTTPHLLVTPKVAVFTPERQARLEAYVEEQARRFVAGEELLNVVPLVGAAS